MGHSVDEKKKKKVIKEHGDKFGCGLVYPKGPTLADN